MLEKVGEIGFYFNGFLFPGGNPGSSSPSGFTNGRGDANGAGGFDERGKFSFVHLGEVLVEKLMEGDVGEKVGGVVVGLRWGVHSCVEKEVRESMRAIWFSFGENSVVS